LNRNLDAPQDLSGNFRDQKNILPLPGSEARFLGRFAPRLVTVPTDIGLARLHKEASSIFFILKRTARKQSDEDIKTEDIKTEDNPAVQLMMSCKCD
jgi:hypothetical protein